MDSAAVAIALQHLRVLDLQPGVSLEEIRQRRRHLAFLFHPDRLGADPPPELRALAEARIREVNAAQDWLYEHSELVLALGNLRQSHDTADDDDGRITLTCPSCGRLGQIRDPRDWQTLRCGCGVTFRVRHEPNRGWFTERIARPTDPPAGNGDPTDSEDADDGRESSDHAAAASQARDRTPPAGSTASSWNIAAIASVLLAAVLFKSLSTSPSPHQPMGAPATGAATPVSRNADSAQRAPTPQPKQGPAAGAFKYASSRSGANVRSGPGTNYALVRTIPDGALVALGTEREGEWQAVQWFDDPHPDTGWMWLPLLSDLPPNVADGHAMWSDTPETFRLGSSKLQVLEVQGEPEEFEATQWQYGDSSVQFVGGRVSGYKSHFSSPLMVSLIPRNSPIDRKTITLGSSPVEVAAVEGAPSEISGSFWGYDLSAVGFDENGRATAFDNRSNNLHLDPSVVSVPNVGEVVEFLDPTEGVYNAGVVLAADPETVRIADERTGQLRELSTSIVFPMNP